MDRELIFKSTYEILDLDMIKDIIKIDQAVYPEDYQSDLGQVVRRFSKHKESFTVVMLDDEIIGYICYFPIDRVTEKKLISGNLLNDSDLEPESILTFSQEKITLYIISMAILPKYQGTLAIKELLEGFTRHIIDLVNKGINIEKIMAVSISKKGYNSLVKMGFKTCNEFQNGSKLLSIYIKDFLDNDKGD